MIILPSILDKSLQWCRTTNFDWSQIPVTTGGPCNAVSYSTVPYGLVD